jgi:hypothetical protein
MLPINLTGAISLLQQALAHNGLLSNAQQVSLSNTLQQLFGQTVLPVTGPHPHHANQVTTTHCVTPTTLNQQPQPARQATLSTLVNVLRIVDGAASYRPTAVTLPTTGETLWVHHPDLVAWIKPHYSPQDCDVLFKLLTQQGVFALVSDAQTGLVETADASGSAVMHQHRWQTDNMLCAPLQQALDPAGWLKNLTTQAAFLAHPHVLQAFRQAITSPNWFRHGGDKNGVPHLFIPDTITVDPVTGLPQPESITLGHSWFSNQRLESQALVLLAMANSVTQGLWPPNHPALYTFVLPAIAHLAQYLMAVNTNPDTQQPDFEAPSISSWEEAPYTGGMTWDTAVTVLAFRALKPILCDPIPAYLPIRNALQATAIAMDPRTQLFNPKAIEAFMATGHQQVLERIVRPLQAGALPMQHPKRPMDMSLAFIVSHAYPLDPDDPVENTRLHLQLIASLQQHLLRANGMIRYPAHTVNGHTVVDSYLASDFWMPDEYRQALATQGMGKASNLMHDSAVNPDVEDRLIQDMLARQAIMQPNTEAEWGLGLSAILQGLGKLRQALIPLIRNTPQVKLVLQQVDDQWDYCLAKTIALISGEGTRSNGAPSTPWRVMEAYEQVSVPAMLASTGQAHRTALPGAHTLAWGQAQLFEALTTTLFA